MARAELTVNLTELPAVKELAARYEACRQELDDLLAALNDEKPFPLTELGDRIHNLRVLAETAQRALAAERAAR